MQTTEQLDIYGNREQNYEKELAKLSKCKTSQTNKDIIVRWHNALFAGNTRQLRVAKLSAQMRKIVHHLVELDLRTELVNLVKEDAEALIGFFNRCNAWSEATQKDYARCLKQFYAWYEDEDPRLNSREHTVLKDTQKFYKYVLSVKTTYRVKDIDFSKIINDGDIHKAIQQGARTVRDKAFLSVLHESGFRAGEILNIRLKDIDMRDTHTLIRVDGKTGQRRVTLVKSVGFLGNWLNTHPYKESSNSHLWINESPNLRQHLNPLRHRGAQKLVNRCFDRVQMTKRHNLHWFRHSRATLYAPHMTEAIMCKYFGWVIGSKEVRRYVHLCGKQVEDRLLDMYGIKKENNKPQVKACACGLQNSAESKYCMRCGKPLDLATIEQEQQLTAKAMEFMAEIAADPLRLKRFEEFKQQLAQETPEDDH